VPFFTPTFEENSLIQQHYISSWNTRVSKLLWKPRVSISPGLRSVPGRDKHQNRQTDRQHDRITVANTRVKSAKFLSVSIIKRIVLIWRHNGCRCFSSSRKRLRTMTSSTVSRDVMKSMIHKTVMAFLLYSRCLGMNAISALSYTALQPASWLASARGDPYFRHHVWLCVRRTMSAYLSVRLSPFCPSPCLHYISSHTPFTQSGVSERKCRKSNSRTLSIELVQHFATRDRPCSLSV